MTFDSEIGNWMAKKDRTIRRIFVASTEEVERSIIDGSKLTGAKGQPVGQYPNRRGGTLRNSWVSRFLDAENWRITTNIIYAPIIEVAAGLTLRSSVGGFHSVKLTRIGWPRIVEAMGRKFGRP